MEAQRWNAPTGDRLLGLLRGDRSSRPRIDPGLAGGLRAWLQDALYEAGGEPVLATPFQFGFATPVSPRTPVARLMGQLTTTLFVQRFTMPDASDPVEAAAAQLRGRALDEPLDALLASEDRAYVIELAADLRRRWPELPAAWFPRFRDPIAVELSGGDLRIYACPTLTLGTAAGTHASVALVQTVCGPILEGHRRGGHLLALAETLRSGAIPFQVVTASVDTGEVEALPVSEQLVANATRTLVAGITEHSNLVRPRELPVAA